jgi:hypothetical protein
MAREVCTKCGRLRPDYIADASCNVSGYCDYQEVKKRPVWTVLYNLTSAASPWVGTAWEFFDDEALARSRYEELAAKGSYPTLRPYYSSQDKPHLGAIHPMRGEG